MTVAILRRVIEQDGKQKQADPPCPARCSYGWPGTGQMTLGEPSLSAEVRRAPASAEFPLVCSAPRCTRQRESRSPYCAKHRI